MESAASITSGWVGLIGQHRRLISSRNTLGVPRDGATCSSDGSRLSGIERAALILLGSLHPEKRLHVDHVARAQIAKVTAHVAGELEEILVRFPVGRRFVSEIESILRCRDTCDIGLQKNVSIWLSEKAKHCDDWPGQHARLAPRQGRYDRTPMAEALVEPTLAVEQHIEAASHVTSAGVSVYCVAERHFFEREQQVRARFDAKGSGGNLRELMGVEQAAKDGGGARRPTDCERPPCSCVPTLGKCHRRSHAERIAKIDGDYRSAAAVVTNPLYRVVIAALSWLPPLRLRHRSSSS